MTTSPAGYRLIDTRDDSTVQTYSNLPAAIRIQGVFSLSPVAVGDRQDDYLFCEVVRDTSGRLTKFHDKTGETESRSDATITITETYTAKTVPEAQAELKQGCKDTAYRILDPTDWLSAREFEGGAVMPTATKTWRADVRAWEDTQETAIDGLATLEQLDQWSPTDPPSAPTEISAKARPMQP